MGRLECYKHAWRLHPSEYRAACPTKTIVWQQCHVCGESRNILIEEFVKENNEVKE
jgi:hypothetical protein